MGIVSGYPYSGLRIRYTRVAHRGGGGIVPTGRPSYCDLVMMSIPSHKKYRSLEDQVLYGSGNWKAHEDLVDPTYYTRIVETWRVRLCNLGKLVYG